MSDEKLKSIEQIRRFLSGIGEIDFKIETKEERYAFIERTLKRLGYARLTWKEKGLLRCFLMKVSGYSSAQVKRLVGQYRRGGRVRRLKRVPRRGFCCFYTREDVGLLAQTDEWHSTLSGPATKKLFERAFHTFGQQDYERLSGISVAHLYNLRKKAAYQKLRRTFDKTRPWLIAIGQRRKPYPQGRPGFIRIDSVHQGDLDGVKGLYHINAVDEITQYEVVCSVERISEHYLIPILESILEAFPFALVEFHSDNGSEYINHRVAELLNKLLIEHTKSSARTSNDNALVEGKNAAVIRKHFGYSHIPGRHATRVNEFALNTLTPYINYHRPCFFAITITDKKGKQKKQYRYQDMMTPYEKLKSIPKAKNDLKPGITFKQLDELAYALNDNEAARAMFEEKKKLFRTITHTEKQAA